MIRRIFFAVIAALLLTSMAHARTYKIAIVPWAGWSPANVAEAKGFWKEEGVDVKVAITPNLQQAITLLKNKVIDIKFNMIGSAVGLYMEGMPLRIIAETNWSHGGDKIIVKKELDTNAFKAKPIGVYLNKPSVTYFLNQYLSSIGIRLSETRVIEMEVDDMADHFIQGRFGIIVCYDPVTLRAVKQGNGKVVATSATYQGCIPEGMMGLEDVVKNIPQEDLLKILRGWVRAVRWSQDPANWKAYTDILNNHTFKADKPYSDGELREMVGSVRIHNPGAQLERNQNNGGLHTYLKNLKAFLIENNMLKKDFNPEKIFDNRAMVTVLEEFVKPSDDL
ncbi:ABC transporter substrate-binding protein [Desulfococcaceae bacterium HSG8]|nr:ABC transporter substrate-binding protein [Desulfococcaceae bacterium HSG8]